MVFPSFTARVALVALSAASLLSFFSPASIALSFAHFTKATQVFPVISKMDSASDKEMPYSALGVVAQIAMFHSGYGWAASSLGVFQTSDSGTHWVRTLRGDAAIKSNGQTDFLNKNTAYAILPANNTQSYLYVTHDGGRKWNRNLVPIEAQSVIQISFANSRVGLMMTAPHGAAGPLEPIALYKSSDGGLNMTPIFSISTHSVVFHGLPQEALKTGIYLQTPTTGWITADSWGNKLWLYETKNSGLTWKNRSISLIPTPLKHNLGGNQLPGNPVFFNSSNGILPVTFYGGGFCLYKTSDGGVKWNPTKPLLTKSSVIYDIFNATHIFAKVGQTLYESKNVGQSWYVAGNHAPSGTTLIFVSPSDGYTVGTTLWKTVTGGKTWSQIR